MSSQFDTRPTDRLMVLAAALLFSTGGAAVKLCTLTGWQVACLRSAIAALALLVLLPDARRGWSWRTLPVACAYGATMICFVISSKLTTSANAVFLQSAAPLYVLVLGPILLAEPIRRRDLLFMAALIGGMVLIFGGHQPQHATRRQAPGHVAHHVDQELAPDAVRPTDAPYEDSIR